MQFSSNVEPHYFMINEKHFFHELGLIINSDIRKRKKGLIVPYATRRWIPPGFVSRKRRNSGGRRRCPPTPRRSSRAEGSFPTSSLKIKFIWYANFIYILFLQFQRTKKLKKYVPDGCPDLKLSNVMNVPSEAR